jgi:hypothetical protein
MKKLILFVVLMITVTIAYGQKSIDDLFERYAGKEGFTTITINGNLLKFLSCLSDNNEEHSVPTGLSEIRLLTQDNDSLKVENFYNLVIKDIDLKKYDEFMRIKESDQDLRMLVKSEGDKFKEFLLIAGGKDNALIQIKGSMTFDDAKKFSSDAKKNHGMNIVANIK